MVTLKNLLKIYFAQWKTFMAEGTTFTSNGVVPKFSPSTLMAVGSSVGKTPGQVQDPEYFLRGRAYRQKKVPRCPGP